VRLSQRTARALILRKATQFRSERSSRVMGQMARAPHDRTFSSDPEATHKYRTSDAQRSNIRILAIRHMNRKSFTLRTLEQAVCIVRRNRLVPSRVLDAAGFRGYDR
jgi:hypothetical protein